MRRFQSSKRPLCRWPVFILALPFSIEAFGQSCGTLGHSCNVGSCDDGNACNGTEVCTGPIGFRFCICDSTLPCDDANPCTTDTCLETPRGPNCDHLAGGCSDGIFCNGLEVCGGHGSICDTGAPPCSGDQICDETNDRCVECLSHSDCDDGLACSTDTCENGECRHRWCDSLFCNGRDLCRTQTGCAAGIPPCANAALCNEAALECGDCQSSDECPGSGDCSTGVCEPTWHACKINPCTLSIDSPADGGVYDVGTLVDVVGHGPRGLDIVLVLDESGSISAAEFPLVRDFASKFVLGLPFRGDEIGAKVAICQFSSGSRRILDLNRNQQIVLLTIQNLTQVGGFTCIGCGVDDAADELRMYGRPGAAHMMLVVTDGMNNLPPPDFASHLAGALEACDVHNQVIFAVGVGEASPQEIQQIATPLPGRQTAFMVSTFQELGTLTNAIISEMLFSVYTVNLTLPDQSQTQVLIVDAGGHWQFEDWAILPGENTFQAGIVTLQGFRNESITLMGKFPCHSTCGDLDGDLGVGLRDGAVFQRCFGMPQYNAQECACADLNGDLDVNMADWSGVFSAWESPTSNQPPDCLVP